jgi:phosphodiesterase/alkaline phosphatase D-like protein
LEDQEAVLFLVGDAGNQEFDRNPVLQHMKTAVTALDERGVPTTVVFLGDNVYDEGVREGDA